MLSSPHRTHRSHIPHLAAARRSLFPRDGLLDFCYRSVLSLSLSFFFLMIRPPPSSPLFPSTPLFRPRPNPAVCPLMAFRGFQLGAAMITVSELGDIHRFAPPRQLMTYLGLVSVEDSSGPRQRRSEEHTSELQSPCNLVCRLLLEKK